MMIRLEPAYQSPEEVRKLFTEYTQMCIEGDPSFAEYLAVQNFDEEIAHLEIKYGLPKGRLYLAYCDEQVAGCIGLKEIDEENCEMKRLYVRPEFRGKHIGKILVEKVIDDAKVIGYQHMLLDTFPFLDRAIQMYKQCGFYEIEQYNDCPMDADAVIYLKLDL